MLVANNLKKKGAGLRTDTNFVTFITSKETKQLSLMSKEKVWNELLKDILSRNNL